MLLRLEDRAVTSGTGARPMIAAAVWRPAALPLAPPRSAVITQRAAVRLFGAVDVVGRSLTMTVRQPVDITIRAVVADIPEQSHLRPGGLLPSPAGADVFVSWDMLEAAGPLEAMNWGSRAVRTYVLLPRDGALTRLELVRRLATIAAERVPADWQFLEIDLESRPVSAVAAAASQRMTPTRLPTSSRSLCKSSTTR